MGIHDDDVQRVRDETDITRVISQYVALKKVGRRWSGLCPFHGEKTPSFSVNAEEGFYYCFGCQRSGDSITFAREMEQLDFVGAVEWLAERAGISLRYTNEGDGQKRKERTEFVDLVDKAATFYHERLLNSPDAGKARAYLRQRGYDRATVEQFRIGYAPDEWDTLVRFLKAPASKLHAAGLAFENSIGKPTDFFRGRLMFPILDPNGSAVAFGGRMLPEGQPPKYKNSAQNRIYDKSKILYALNWAKKAVVDADEIIVCEGYTDVIGCFRAGIPRAVATCGTSLTEEHVKLMTKFARRIVLAFDADGAGKAAADKFYGWERSHDIEVRVADLPDGADPGELAESDPERLVAAIEGALPFLAYRINRILDDGDLEAPEGRARAAEIVAGAIAEHPNELVRDQYLRDAAGRCGVEIDQMRRLVANPPRPVVNEESDRYDDDPIYSEPPPQSRRVVPATEVNVLRLLVHQPEEVIHLIRPELFSDETTIATYVLLTTEGWRDRIDEAEPAVAQLIRRLLVEEVTGEPVELVSRTLDGVIVRWRTEMMRAAGSDLARIREYAPINQWLGLRQEEMHLDDTRDAAVTAVVGWLASLEAVPAS
ncbi:MAG: DNA primase [Candidatus Poriferisodalaceae bacterium]|jgi:DNA primase